ncbi:hypothetical protein KI387_037360, partial [Taxus chinensis]
IYVNNSRFLFITFRSSTRDRINWTPIFKVVLRLLDLQFFDKFSTFIEVDIFPSCPSPNKQLVKRMIQCKQRRCL